MKTIVNKGSFTNIEKLIREAKRNTLIRMITLAQKQLNPLNYHLSFEAKKRLRWLYALYYEQDGNITVSAKKVGITRQWLSEIKTEFEKGGNDPRKLEPKSRAPHNTNNRNRIPKTTEDKIIEARDFSEGVWGKEKITRFLKREYSLKVNPNTVNSYLHKHKKIDPKISLKNTNAWKAKKEREKPIYSNSGTPTDNPRVERSHLTDELEFYQKGGLKKSFEEQKQALAEWEHFYNFVRPHQALGYLTPMEFYELWKEKPDEAHDITKKYQTYLAKQKKRLAGARRIKRKEQIESLMKFIDAKLQDKKTAIKRSKLQLINCQLCSLA